MFLALLINCVNDESQSIFLDRELKKDSISNIIIEEPLENGLILEKSYNKVVENPSIVEYKIEFFEYFPDSFDVYKNMYDYKRPLYKRAYYHLKIIKECKLLIDSNIFYKKIIGLSLNGTYQVEGAGSLQHLLSESYKDSPLIFSEILFDDYSNDQIHSFFNFYFDAIHPRLMWADGLPDYFYSIKKRFPEIHEIALYELNKSYQEEMDH